MKTRPIVAILLVILTSTAVLAGTKDLTPSSEVGKLLERTITYPTSGQYTDVEGTVRVALKLTEDRKVDVTVLSTDSDLLSKYVKMNIKRLEPRLARLMKDEEQQIFRIKFEVK